VPVHGREYSQLFHLADQALNTAKQRGKHCCVLMGSRGAGQVGPVGTLTLDSVTMILEERNVSSNAMWMGRDAFINIYRYMNRYLERYHGVAYRALLTINILSETADKQTRADIVAQFRTIMQQSLRNSDVMVEVSENQIFLLLPQMHEASIDVVMNRLMNKWEQLPCHDQAIITWETGKVHLTEREAPRQDVRQECCRVLVISEDRIVRELAESVLGEQGDRVTALRMGAGAPELVKAERPDVILLDETLPDTDGLSVLRALKADEGCRSVPVLLVTADETHGAEAVRMQPGAEDILQKPLVPELLALRVRNTAERIRLKEKLS
jgi:CheY-like chemotaxis protein